MIHIELKPDQKPAKNWFDLVKDYDTALKNQNKNASAFSAKKEVEKKYDLSTESGRKGFIEYLDDLWNNDEVELKEIFFESEAIIGSKCWFSEVDSEGAELEIEHFRPKKRINTLDYVTDVGISKQLWEFLGKITDAQIKRAEGYYWLTYDWTNYKLSCKITNTRKGNYFPLLPNSKPATKHGEEINEKPVLLNPCIKEETELIIFEKRKGKITIDERGKKIHIDEVYAVPVINNPEISGIIDTQIMLNDEEKINFLRAIVSIWVYELNDMKKIKPSRAKIWNETEENLDDIIKNNSSFDSRIFEKIKELTHKTAKHCGVARQVVREYFDSGRITEEQYKNCFYPPIE